MIRQRRSLFLLVVCLICAATMAWGRGPIRLAGGGNPDPDDKVTLCHVPRGNPENAHTITVGEAAVPAHLAHGDSLGECPPPCVAGPPSPVPKTGKTTCWSGEYPYDPIDCAGTGQDGEYQKGVSASPRFTDNLDGTVKDNLTGLVWLKDAGCMGAMNWSSALAAANSLSAASAPPACALRDGSLAGSWRLPNIKELQSLIDYGQVFPALPSGHPFSGVQSNFYWSSTSGAYLPYYAWFVNLDYGLVIYDYMFYDFDVWPVRGGQ